ncbi:MAG TPA: cupin, partial [Saprospirales bacterium]|nr:cupin [Saprospirales bacterium]
MIQIKNFFKELPLNRDCEFFEDILQQKGFKLERIISFGQNTPENEWY